MQGFRAALLAQMGLLPGERVRVLLAGLGRLVRADERLCSAEIPQLLALVAPAAQVASPGPEDADDDALG